MRRRRFLLTPLFLIPRAELLRLAAAVCLGVFLLAAGSAVAAGGGGDGDSSGVGSPMLDPDQAPPGTVFRVDDPDGRNTISFESRAPLENFVGTSNRLLGFVVFDPEHPERGGHGRLEVPVASLRTGIPLRDTHLLGEEWLDAEAYPGISFEITGVKDVKEVQKADSFRTFSMTAVGGFTLHGRTEEIEVPGRVTYLEENAKTRELGPGNLLAVRAEFTIGLGSYGIEGFEGVVGSKVSETITVSVSFTASDAPESGTEDPPNAGKGEGENAGGR